MAQRKKVSKTNTLTQAGISKRKGKAVKRLSVVKTLHDRDVILTKVFQSVLSMYDNQMLKTEQEHLSYINSKSKLEAYFGLLGVCIKPTNKEFNRLMKNAGYSIKDKTNRQKYRIVEIFKYFSRYLGCSDYDTGFLLSENHLNS